MKMRMEVPGAYDLAPNIYNFNTSESYVLHVYIFCAGSIPYNEDAALANMDHTDNLDHMDNLDHREEMVKETGRGRPAHKHGKQPCELLHGN